MTTIHDTWICRCKDKGPAVIHLNLAVFVALTQEGGAAFLARGAALGVLGWAPTALPPDPLLCPLHQPRVHLLHHSAAKNKHFKCKMFEHNLWCLKIATNHKITWNTLTKSFYHLLWKAGCIFNDGVSCNPINLDFSLLCKTILLVTPFSSSFMISNSNLQIQHNKQPVRYFGTLNNSIF